MTAFTAHRQHLMQNPRLIAAVEDRTDRAHPVVGELVGYTSYDVTVCWSRLPEGSSHLIYGTPSPSHCIRHGDVRLDDPDFELLDNDTFNVMCDAGVAR